jgi:FdhD protein
MRTSAITVPVTTVEPATGILTPRQDTVAVEDPLEIRIGRKRIAVTMRTPGHDPELAAGFLFGEGILKHPSQIFSFDIGRRNEVEIVLQPGAKASNLEGARRNFYMTSSCGVCGKASIDAVRAQGCKALPTGFSVAPAIVDTLPARLRQAQPTFDQTGGLHAAALFDSTGHLLSIFEDVGRHNAVDKLIGHEFLAGRLPLIDRIILVSGRTSFVQKTVMAGAPVLAAVGAPSSLAVELALRFRLTLCGFVRQGRFNVYSAPERLTNIHESSAPPELS